jgi:hypothetical protein
VHEFLDKTGSTVILLLLSFPHLTSSFYDIQFGNREDEIRQYDYTSTIQEQAQAAFERVHFYKYFQSVQLILRGSKQGIRVNAISQKNIQSGNCMITQCTGCILLFF